MEEPSSVHGVADLTFGSLFAGVGGFDLGFEAAGWTPRWQVEWDARCQSVLARHWPEVPRFGDVCDVGVIPLAGRPDDGHDGRGPQPDIDGRESPRDLLEPVDCITYGFPCQDLSVAGRRAGLDGDRSGLFFEAMRIIKEMRDATGGKYPTWAVAENVPGLLSADRGAAMGRCLDALADIGAVGIEWAVLDAQHFGVPQRRRRVFLVAWWDPRIGSGGPIFPVRESCGRDFATRKQAGQAVAALTGTGVGTCGADDNQGQAGHLIPAITDPSRLDDYETWETGRPAQTLNAFDNGTESRATVLAWSLRSRDGIASLEIEPSGVFPALKTGTQRQQGIGVRRLTPRECERLMGWPDDHTRWAADGTEIADTNRYKMCGNGVVAPVSEWVANRLIDASRAAG